MLHHTMSKQNGPLLNQIMSKEEIKFAFKKILFEFHPVKHPFKTYNTCIGMASYIFCLRSIRSSFKTPCGP